MNRDELAKILEREGFSPYSYNLDANGCTDEGFCLEASKYGVWSVYCMERGKKSFVMEFATEHDACEYYFQRMMGENLPAPEWQIDRPCPVDIPYYPAETSSGKSPLFDDKGPNEITVIQRDVQNIIDQMGATQQVSCYVKFERLPRDRRPFVYIENDEYYYIHSDSYKRIDYERRTTKYYLLMYWIARLIARANAGYGELRHLIYNIDSRRLFFRKELELIHRVNPVFEEWCRKEYEEIIANNPFSDGLPNKIDWEGWEVS